jgi:hypothetical protein
MKSISMAALVMLITSCEGVATFANHEKCWYASRIVIASDKTDAAADALMCMAWHGAVMMSSSTFSGTSNSADLIKSLSGGYKSANSYMDL